MMYLEQAYSLSCSAFIIMSLSSGHRDLILPLLSPERMPISLHRWFDYSPLS